MKTILVKDLLNALEEKIVLIKKGKKTALGNKAYGSYAMLEDDIIKIINFSSKQVVAEIPMEHLENFIKYKN